MFRSGASRTNKNLSYKMPGIARSVAKKKKMARANQEQAYAEAMKEYRDEEKKPESERKSRKAICRDVAEKWKAMRKPVTVSAETLRRRGRTDLWSVHYRLSAIINHVR